MSTTTSTTNHSLADAMAMEHEVSQIGRILTQSGLTLTQYDYFPSKDAFFSG